MTFRVANWYILYFPLSRCSTDSLPLGVILSFFLFLYPVVIQGHKDTYSRSLRETLLLNVHGAEKAC